MSETLLDSTVLESTENPSKVEEGKSSLLDESGKDVVADEKSKDAVSDSKETPPAPKDVKPDETKQPTAPEKYASPVLPENVAIDENLLKEVDSYAKSLNLPQEQYQKLVDLGVKLTETNVAKTMESFNKTVTEWKEQSIKELGADYKQSLSVASKAIDRVFADPEKNKQFREMMKETGLGNWPLMIQLCNFVGKAISEDKLVDGRPDSKQDKSPAERIYGSAEVK